MNVLISIQLCHIPFRSSESREEVYTSAILSAFLIGVDLCGVCCYWMIYVALYLSLNNNNNTFARFTVFGEPRYSLSLFEN